MRLFAMAGSLRAASLNKMAIRAAVHLAPEGVEVVAYDDLGNLPLFNPDLDTEMPPAPVAALRRQIGLCDGLLICTPEYAHGISGPMKNALDWLVASIEFPGKPVALINTSPRANHAQDHLREVLNTMSARLVDRSCIALPLLGRPSDAAAIEEDAELAARLRTALADFACAIREMVDRDGV